MKLINKIYDFKATTKNDMEDTELPSLSDIVSIMDYDATVKYMYSYGLSNGLTHEQILILIIQALYKDKKVLKERAKEIYNKVFHNKGEKNEKN